jgi:hypothetical protein
LRLCLRGNAWSATDLFRTWMPQPLFGSHGFVTSTWRLIAVVADRATGPRP